MPRRTVRGSACATGVIGTRSLQEEWNAHGEDAFQYEILEKLEDDVHPLAVAARLKEMRSRWIAQLGARGI